MTREEMELARRFTARRDRTRTVAMFASLVALLCLGPVGAETQTTQQPGSYPSLPSETPARFEAVTDAFDYVQRDAMIPMRDGVRLHTVILVPKGATRAPILLTRTPYDATALTEVDPMLGGESALAALLEAAHQRGLRVLLAAS